MYTVPGCPAVPLANDNQAHEGLNPNGCRMLPLPQVFACFDAPRWVELRRRYLLRNDIWAERIVATS